MTDPEDFEGKRGQAQEQDPVVAYTEPEFCAIRLELDDITCAGGKAMIECCENGYRCFPFNSAEIGLRRWRPDNDLLVWH